MFYYIEGTVEIMDVNLAVIDAAGVGYACFTTVNTLSRLEKGKRARLYTYCNIREDAFDIYGFYDIAEKRCFEQLLSVSGVGPKAALSILSSSTPEGVALAIVSENDKVLTAAPGIGKRIAQRIILELKDKMAKENGTIAAGTVPLPGSVGVPGKKLADATAALTVLGYSNVEITAALRSMDIEAMTLEEIIREVLRNSVKQG